MSNFQLFKSEEQEAIFKSNSNYKRVVVKKSIDENLFSQYGTGQILEENLNPCDAHRAISKKDILQFFANNSLNTNNVTFFLLEKFPSFLVRLLLLNGHYLFFDAMSVRNIDPTFNYGALQFQFNDEVNQAPNRPTRIRMRLSASSNRPARIRMRLSASSNRPNYFKIFFDKFPVENDIVLFNYQERPDLNGIWYVENGPTFVPTNQNNVQFSFRRYPCIPAIQKSYHLDPFVFIGKLGEKSGGKMYIQKSPLYIQPADTQTITPMDFKEQNPFKIIPLNKDDIQNSSDVIQFFAPNGFDILNFKLIKSQTFNPTPTSPNNLTDTIDVRMDTYTFDLTAGTIKKIVNDESSEMDLRLLFFSDLYNETNTTSSNNVSCQVNYKDVENLMYLAYLRNDFPTQTTPYSYQLQYQQSISAFDIQSTNSGTRIRSIILKPGSQLVFERLEFFDPNQFPDRSFISICGFS